ncbi:MAG: YncE family protein [Gemmatimonadota bacterium]
MIPTAFCYPIVGLWLASGLVAACGENGPNDRSSHPPIAVVDSVPLAGNPYGVAISKQGLVYICLLAANQVARTSLPIVNFGPPIAVGLVPPHVVFNPAGTRAYATDQNGQALEVIDVASGLAVNTIPLGHDGFNLIVRADGKQIFASVSTGQVYVVDAATDAIIDSIILGPVVNGFARHPNENLIYISSRDGGTVSEVDAATHVVARTFTTGGMPQRLAVSPNGKELLIANETLGLDIWNLITGTRDTSLAMAAYGLGLSPDGVHAYVTDPQNGIIRVVDRVGRFVDTVLTVGGTPRNVAFNAAGTTAIITNQADFITVVH